MTQPVGSGMPVALGGQTIPVAPPPPEQQNIEISPAIGEPQLAGQNPDLTADYIYCNNLYVRNTSQFGSGPTTYNVLATEYYNSQTDYSQLIATPADYNNSIPFAITADIRPTTNPLRDLQLATYNYAGLIISGSYYGIGLGGAIPENLTTIVAGISPMKTGSGRSYGIRFADAYSGTTLLNTSYSVYISTPTRTDTATVTSRTGLQIDNQAASWITNSYGINVMYSAGNSGTRMGIALNGNDFCMQRSGGSLVNSTTEGFIVFGKMGGTPTGVPINAGVGVPTVIDTTASKLWAYIGGAWKSVTFT